MITEVIAHACTAWSCPAVMTNFASWAPAIKPAALYPANGRQAPYLDPVKWTAYKHAYAIGQATLHAMRAGHYHTWKITIRLSRTRFHKVDSHGDGGYFYSRMLWEKLPARVLAVARWLVNKHGYWVSG